VPDHRHEDFQPLLDALILFAKQALENDGAFLPHAATMALDGEIALLGAHTEEEKPAAPVVLGLLETALRESARQKTCRAVGICVNIRFATSPDQPKTDAIQVFLEHREGHVVNVILPYEKAAVGKLLYGELIAVRGDPKIFIQTN
jgi:hypothetical protein